MMRADADLERSHESCTANGFDDPRGHVSQDLAVRAEQAWRRGSGVEARALFAEAAALETAIARDVTGRERVRGVLAVSAVALWYKAAAYEVGRRHALAFLADAEPIDEPSRRELAELAALCSRAG